jgi:hypothetical protein
LRRPPIVPGIHCRYQHHLPPEEVLASSEYDPALRAAVYRHGLRVHQTIDVLVEWNSPRAGLDGILLEAKSGNQSYDAAVAQLRSYRATIRRSRGGRWLVWGVIESEESEAVTDAAVTNLLAESQRSTQDLWFFSSASAISRVLEQLGLANLRTETVA